MSCSKFEDIRRYQEALEHYFDLKAFMYDARMVDKYKELDESIDFAKETERLERKIAKLEPVVAERKRESKKLVIDSIRNIFESLDKKLDING